MHFAAHGVREHAHVFIRVLATALLLWVGTSRLSARSLDPHSFARPDEARVTDVALDLTADFSTHTLRGTATLTLVLAPGAREVVLDTKELTIASVNDQAGESLGFALGGSDPLLGRPLTVSIAPTTTAITVHYITSPDARALQWLSPAQTAGRVQPYLFSQGESIYTRTWVPTQDSPGIRQTYRARIVVPAPLTAVMSAEMLTPDGVTTPDGRAFEFKLDRPIPPYLIALAVGDIAFRPLGSRTGVYAEPSVLDRAAYEFADLENMVDAAERLVGPYRWGRYEIIVLPPSFPYGGMENPRLTFATPTVLAGDRSLTSLAAHELAHSWSGNLVTNATWSDFWLNEGFTTYVENRIMESLYGPERAAMLQQVDRTELLESLNALPRADTSLVVDLRGRDPDDGSSNVPYGKGGAFLRMLERAFGRAVFDPWLRGYLDHFAFQSITSTQFLEYLRATLLSKTPGSEDRLHVHAWLYEPGLPANAPVVQSAALARASADAAGFAAGRTSASALNASAWTTQEWQEFLAKLPRPLPQDRMAELEKTYALSNRGNSEVLFQWLRLAVASHYEPAFPALEVFLTSQGRMKFVVPLYRALGESEWGRPMAERIFRTARPTYHPLTVAAIEQALGGKR